MIFGKSTKRKWISAVIWSIVACFVASIFVMGAQFTYQRAQKAKEKTDQNSGDKEEQKNSQFTSEELKKPLAEVNGESIVLREYYDELQSTSPEYKNYFKLNTLDGKLDYLKNMANMLIIKQKGKELKINISDEEAVDSIVSNYKRMGQVIDKDKLLAKIKEGSPDLARVIDGQKVPMIIEKIQANMMTDLAVSQDSVEAFYLQHKNEFKKETTVNGKSSEIQLGLNDVASDIRTILEKEKVDKVAYSFYDSHQEMFRSEEKTLIAHIFLDKNSKKRKDLFITQTGTEELQSYYKMRERDFLTPKNIRANHIYLKFSDVDKTRIVFGTNEVREYYEKNIADYQYPEKMRAQHILLAPDSQENRKKVTITDEDVQKYYKDNLDRYKDPEKVHAQHILVNQEEEAKDLYGRLKNGEDFTTLAKQFSKDSASAENGGDLGLFARGEMTKAFEDTAFAAEIGKICEPVKTSFGYHIIKVLEHKAENTKKFEEVKKEIEDELAGIKVRDYLKKQAEEIRQSAVKGEDFAQLAMKFSNAKTASKGGDLGFFYRGRQPDGFNDQIIKDEIMDGKSLDQAIEGVVFKLGTEEISTVIEGVHGIHVFKILEREDKKPMPFAAVDKKVQEKLLDDKAKKTVENQADELIDKIAKGADFTVLARENSKADSAKNGGDTGFIPQGKFQDDFDKSLIDPYWIAGKSLISQLEDKLFSMRKGEVGKVDLNDGVEVLKIAEIKSPVVQPFEKVADQVLEKKVSEKADKEARRLAEAALAELKQGISFEEVAKKYSDGSTSQSGGTLGLVNADGSVDQEESIRFKDEGGTFGYNFTGGSFSFGLNLDPNFKVYCQLLDTAEYSPVVDTQLGYHVIRAVKKEPGKIKPYSEVQKDIEEMLNSSIADSEITKYYENNLDQYKEPEKVRLRHILLKDEETAKKVKTQLSQGENFMELARKFSLDQSREMGGDIGEVPRGKLPKEIEDVAFSLEVGKNSDIIKSPYGFHLLQVTDKKPARTIPLAEKKEEIKAQLLKPRKDKAFQYWMQEAHNLTRVKLDQENIINFLKRL
ncbi:MAG: peptidylprolyl isomerase [Candidatus Wallbacteria bacterium]|nr:peptidylprolyl isomerase [Candidatus Wallbacteria bacterium]